MKMQTSSRAASYVILLATISLLPACGGSGGGSAVGTGSAVTSTGTLGTGGTGGTGSTASSGIAASASYSVSGAVTGLAKGKKIVLLKCHFG